MKEKARAILAIAAVGALVFAGCAKKEATVQPAAETQAQGGAVSQPAAGTTTNAATTTTTTTTTTSAVNTETATTVAAAPAATLTTAEDFAKAGKFADVTRLLKQDHAAYNRGEKAADISDRLESSVFGAYKKSADYTALQTWLGTESVGTPAASRADVVKALSANGISLDEFGFFKLAGTSPSSAIYGRATIMDGSKSLKLEVIGEAGPSSGATTAFTGLYPFSKSGGTWKAVDKYFLKASSKSWDIPWSKVMNDAKVYTTSVTSLTTISNLGGVKVSAIK